MEVQVFICQAFPDDPPRTPQSIIRSALAYAGEYGMEDGAHHKAWVIDQIVRILTDSPLMNHTVVHANGDRYITTEMGESEEYKKFVADYCNGEDGPNTYEWDTGVAP